MHPTAGEIAGLQLAHVRADTHDATHDFVPRHHRIQRVAPVVPTLVQIRVADAAVENLDLHVQGTRIAALEIERGQGRLRIACRIAADFDHGEFLVGPASVETRDEATGGGLRSANCPFQYG